MKIEWGDFKALTMVINIMLIMRLGLVASWFGLAIALICLANNYRIYKYYSASFRWNSVIMDLAQTILNIYFLSILK